MKLERAALHRAASCGELHQGATEGNNLRK